MLKQTSNVRADAHQTAGTRNKRAFATRGATGDSGEVVWITRAAKDVIVGVVP